MSINRKSITRKLLKGFLFVFFALFVNNVFGQWEEIAKVLPESYEHYEPEQFFGYTVDIDGNYAVVGAHGYNNNQGIAFVYYNNGSQWILQDTLLASDGSTDNSFGSSVSISGQTIAVKGAGSVYIFTRNETIWSQEAKLISSDGANARSICISGETVVIGASNNNNENGLNSGSAYIFVRSGKNWSQQAKLTASDGGYKHYFGWSVGISGETVVVGSINATGNETYTGATYVFTRTGTSWSQQSKLIASDGAGGDAFGRAVSISGDTVVIGANGDDDNGAASGSAYIFNRNGTTWSQQAKLIASDGEASEYFGSSVCISGKTVIVGAHNDDNDGIRTGSAYVFTHNGTSWNQQTKLFASDGTGLDLFGSIVSISGETIIIGAYYDDDNAYNTGSVYFFTASSGSWPSSESQKISSPPVNIIPNCNFGYSVSIDSNYAVIGVPGENSDQGSVNIYYYDGNQWNLQAKLTASDGASGDRFGYSVSISGETVVVGAYGDDDNDVSAGSAYIYTRNGTSWSQQAKIIAEDGARADMFGYSVSISENTIAVSAIGDDNYSGSAYIFNWNGASWSQQTKLTAFDGGATNGRFGNSVCISGETVVIGWANATGNETYSGAAYVFTRTGTSWSQQAKLTAFDGASGDAFGNSVSISNETVVVGAHGDDDNGSSSGSIYVYTRSGTDWNQQAKLTASDATFLEYFGFSVNISGEKVIVGATGYENLNPPGSAYIFSRNGSSWKQQTKLTASDGASLDKFGCSVGISGEYTLVGAYGDDDNGDEAGSAYFFNGCFAPDTPTLTATNSAICQGETVNIEVSTDNDLNSATNWVLYAESCGGTEIESNSNGSFTVSPVETTTYYIRGEGGCVSSGDCGNITITVNQKYDLTETVEVCSGDSYTFPDGTTQENITTQVIYTSSLLTENGCDSIITTTVEVNPVYNLDETVEVCSGDSYTFPDGTTHDDITTQVIYTSSLLTINGCDSIISTTVDVNPAYNLDETIEVCSGDSYTFPDGTTQDNITAQVIYTSSLLTENGCDSIITTTVEVNPVYNLDETIEVCSGDSYTFPDGTTQDDITAQVIYTSNLLTENGCDSIITTTVEVNPVYDLNETVEVCSGDSYTFPDGTTHDDITAQVFYTSNLLTIKGCDSIITTTVDVNPAYNLDETVEICSGDSYTFPDGTIQDDITAQFIYTSSLLTIKGCDSIITTTVNAIDCGSSECEIVSTRIGIYSPINYTIDSIGKGVEAGVLLSALTLSEEATAEIFNGTGGATVSSDDEITTGMVVLVTSGNLSNSTEYTLSVAHPKTACTPPSALNMADGIIDPAWLTATSYDTLVSVNNDPYDPTDFLARFKILANRNYLYVLVDVNDDNFIGGQDDEIKLFLDADNSKLLSLDYSTPYIEDLSLVFRKNENPIGINGNYDPELLENILFEWIENSSSSHQLEVAIPWDKTNIPIGFANLCGFDIEVNDYESDYERYCNWRGIAGLSASPAAYGTINIDAGVLIPEPKITVTSPNGGEFWDTGSNQYITWTSKETSGIVDIEFSTDRGSSWSQITTGTPDDGSYSWTVPSSLSTNCLIRIIDSNGSPFDQSDSEFIISSSEKETTGHMETYSNIGPVNVRRALPVTMPKDAVIESISIYHQGSNDGSKLIMGVYSDNSGAPGILLGVSPTTTINTNEGWQTVTLEIPVYAAKKQKVWLAFTFENCPGIRFRAGTPGRVSSYDSWSGDMPVNFGSSTQADYIYSIYCTFKETLGEETVGHHLKYNNVGQVNNRRAIPAIMPEDGAIKSISIYHQGGNEESKLVLGVYADNSGAPGNLLGVTQATAINSNEGWQTVDLQSPVNADSAETVWLAFVFENCPGIRYQAGTPGRASSYDTWSGGMPTSFGASTQADYNYSIYAIYEEPSKDNIIGNTLAFDGVGAITNRRAMPVTMTEDGAIDSISIYHQGASDGSKLILGVYTDNSGLPGNLIAATTATVINSSEGWQTVALETPANALEGETVWLAFVFENCPGIRFQAGTPGRASSFETWAEGMPANFGVSSQADYIYSIYATYGEPSAERTAGYTSAFSGVGPVTNRRAVPVTISEDGSIESISIYHQGSNDGSRILLGIYDDDAGLPGSSLGVTPATVINSNEGWQTVDLINPVSAASGENVWLAFVFENCPGIRFQAGTPGRASSIDTWAEGMPANFRISSQANYIYSIYCSYLLANNASSKTNSNDNTLTEKVGSTLTDVNDNKFADKTSVIIFPNPTSGELNITLDKVFDNELKITFYNTLGSVVKVLDIAPQNNNISINLSELKQGIYTLIIADKNEHSIIHRANIIKQ